VTSSDFNIDSTFSDGGLYDELVHDADAMMHMGWMFGSVASETSFGKVSFWKCGKERDCAHPKCELL